MKKLGFTLAEVLITLIVIGVIAALTIPAIMNNIKGREYKSALNKAFSTTNQALAMHYATEGEGVSASRSQQSPFHYFGHEIFLKHLKMTPIYYFPGHDTWCTDGGGAMSVDGIIYCIDLSNINFGNDSGDPATTACNANNTVPCANDFTKPNLYVDVNGDKGPNELTTDPKSPKDQYQAMLYDQKAIPFGEATQQFMYSK